MSQISWYANLRWKIAQYVEGKWWRNYLKAKPPAQYLAEKSAYWQRTLLELGWQPVPDRNVLDAGCGPAGIFIHLHHTERFTALDPLLDNYERNLPIFSRRSYPAVTFRQQRLEDAPFTEKPFDAIYCLNAINHVADWWLAFDRLTAYARPGTRMILSSDVHRHDWLLPFFRALPGDILHPQQHDAAAYRHALVKNGWAIDNEITLRRETIFDYVAWIVTYEG